MDEREARFRAKVERRDGHDVWTGATDAKGTGLVRIDGRLRTVQRAVWEFARGPLSPGERVLACAGEKGCVRIDHLRLAPKRQTTHASRRRRGTGSMREMRPGVWRLTVSDGPGSDGQPRRRHRTVHGDEHDALEDLALLAETTNEPTRLGDLRVRELVDRYLCWLAPARNVARLRRLAAARIEPAIGLEYAALVDGALIDGLLRRLRTEGAGDDEIRATYRLLHDTYAWARRRRWTNSTRCAT
ncbi:MAG TPA: HNH endonuclease [Acidimicrobiales bacterium]|nr:HNH endonuclease [Acidimicrobiales bacterium]